MKIVAIIQSRMTSTRLPGKALVDIAGKPLTGWIVDRARQCRRLDEVVLAIPAEPEDDPLARRFSSSCRIHRGSLHDVLDRYWSAAKDSGADAVVRVCGDNPLFEAPIMDAAVERFLAAGVDYANTLGCPIGIGAEVFRYDALDRAHREATEAYQHEHVTPYLYESPGRFRTTGFDMSDLTHGVGKSGVRLTVDTPEDLEVIREIFKRLLPLNLQFGLKEIADLIRADGALFKKNLHVRQKSFKESET
ncbi:MAG: hypothetical protein A3G34_14775 [Candidatus Lindowbacteria bacterium RIFCSPLOWO2_12_FULL_62_27]|nr:MAG: hypothetical protein A3I06_10055 [Candidatus Lindowbacteria bacterium RIFCSPLOWO2_02_FULL_62_12]OGH63120.1 MAG: hypothetical protein A3G34_14775 [Candidatus Lindowbacteria bacterium RIFCSPLOWO2_12_FULL_62_27]